MRPPKEPPSWSLPDVHFRLSQEDYQHIKSVAKAEERSAAYIIARIVREWIKKEKTSK